MLASTSVVRVRMCMCACVCMQVPDHAPTQAHPVCVCAVSANELLAPICTCAQVDEHGRGPAAQRLRPAEGRRPRPCWLSRREVKCERCAQQCMEQWQWRRQQQQWYRRGSGSREHASAPADEPGALCWDAWVRPL